MKRKINKYTGFITQRFTKVLEFRTEIIIWIILDFLPFMMLFILWNASQKSIEDINSIIVFYLLVSFIRGTSSTHFDDWRAEEIRMGRIDTYLTKPMSYISQIALTEIAGKVFYLLLFLPLYIIFIFLLQMSFHFSLPEIQASSILLFILLLVTAFLLNLLMSVWVVLSAFWLESAKGLQHFKWISVALASGSLIPFEYLPGWLQTVTNLLPFQFLYKVPIDVLLYNQIPSAKLILYLVITVLSSMYFTQFLWDKAIKQYVSAGG